MIPPELKSLEMSRVRTKGTAPELVLRSALHALGFRYRLNHKDLPGKPDIVLPKYKTVIFVHGCFWHHHEGCSKSKMPKTRTDFWTEKISANIERDRRNVTELDALKWRIAIVWECSLKRSVASEDTIVKLIRWILSDEDYFDSDNG